MVFCTKVSDSKDIIQLSYSIFSNNMEKLKTVSCLINENIGKVDYYGHFTLDQIKKEGKHPKKVFQEMAKDFTTISHIIAHCTSFHVDILIRYFNKLSIKTTIPKSICTMKTTIKFCALPGDKFPKLEELFEKCFGKQKYIKNENGDDTVTNVFKIFKYLSGK